MDWFVLAIISVITGSIASILSRVLMKDENSDPIAYAIVFQLLCTIFIFVFSLWNGFVLPPIKEYPINFLILTVLYSFASVFSFKAYQLAQASEVIIAASTRSILAIIAGIIFLQEVFTLQQLIGTICIFAAVLFVNFKSKRFQLTKGTWYALGFAACFGLAVVNDKYIITTSGTEAISYTAVSFLLPTLAIIITNPSAMYKSKRFLQINMLTKMVLLSVFYSASAISFFLAFQYGAQASQLSPITQSSVIVTVILAALLLNERDHIAKKVIAAILVMIGVYLLR